MTHAGDGGWQRMSRERVTNGVNVAKTGDINDSRCGMHREIRSERSNLDVVSARQTTQTGDTVPIPVNLSPSIVPVPSRLCHCPLHRCVAVLGGAMHVYIPGRF